jgi:hypothetical protein
MRVDHLGLRAGAPSALMEARMVLQLIVLTHSPSRQAIPPDQKMLKKAYVPEQLMPDRRTREALPRDRALL